MAPQMIWRVPALLGLTLLTGCGLNVESFRVTDTRYQKTNAEQVSVAAATPPKKTFAAIAFLEWTTDVGNEAAARRYRSTHQQKIVQDLQKEASALGANAIIALHDADEEVCQVSSGYISKGWRVVTRGLAILRQ